MPAISNKQHFTILGSGAAVPRLHRTSAANLLQTNDGILLIDAGWGCLARLLELGVNPDNIGYVCLTHRHPDHCSELVSLVFGRYNNPEQTWSEPLHITGGPGLHAWWEVLCIAWSSLRKPFDAGLLLLHEIAAGESQIMGPSRVEALATDHKPESLAYRFTCAGRRVVISGDTGPDTALADFAQDADLLVLECGAGLAPLAGHLTVAQAAAIALQARPKMLILTHFYHTYDVDALQAAFSAVYTGKFAMACDLLTVEV